MGSVALQKSYLESISEREFDAAWGAPEAGGTKSTKSITKTGGTKSVPRQPSTTGTVGPLSLSPLPARAAAPPPRGPDGRAGGGTDDQGVVQKGGGAEAAEGGAGV